MPFPTCFSFTTSAPTRTKEVFTRSSNHTDTWSRYGTNAQWLHLACDWTGAVMAKSLPIDDWNMMYRCADREFRRSSIQSLLDRTHGYPIRVLVGMSGALLEGVIQGIWVEAMSNEAAKPINGVQIDFDRRTQPTDAWIQGRTDKAGYKKRDRKCHPMILASQVFNYSRRK